MINQHTPVSQALSILMAAPWLCSLQTAHRPERSLLITDLPSIKSFLDFTE